MSLVHVYSDKLFALKIVPKSVILVTKTFQKFCSEVGILQSYSVIVMGNSYSWISVSLHIRRLPIDRGLIVVWNKYYRKIVTLRRKNKISPFEVVDLMNNAPCELLFNEPRPWNDFVHAGDGIFVCDTRKQDRKRTLRIYGKNHTRLLEPGGSNLWIDEPYNSVVDIDDLRIFRYADINRVCKSAFSRALSSLGYLDVADVSLDVFRSIPGKVIFTTPWRTRCGWEGHHKCWFQGVIRCSLDAS